MNAQSIAVLQTGLVTSVGFTAVASCAAFRSKITNPSETRFVNSDGEWIMAHQVLLDQPWRGLAKLAKMAARAIEEALQEVPKASWNLLPLLLCVAERERPGRTPGLDDELLPLIEQELGVSFSPQSAVVPQGRVGLAMALTQARTLILKSAIPRVAIAATDSLLSWPTLSHFVQQNRLLTGVSANGFVPGEGAGAVLIGPAEGRGNELICSGIGFGQEMAHIDSGEPLRGDGLTQAIKAVLDEAGCQIHDIDFRITDNSGEQYYFKEAALALARTLRIRKEDFQIWHPAEASGEMGAVSCLAQMALGHAACHRNYTAGPKILLHCSNDAGSRAAIILEFVCPA